MKITPFDSRCSLLVLSCDAYADLWRPFFTLLIQNWPACPYRVFLGAGVLKFDAPDVTTLGSNAGRDWSQCVLDYLEQIPTPYVLLMLDDFFLRRKVTGDEIHHCLDFAEHNNAKQVRLVPRPGPSRNIPGVKWIGWCDPDLRYRISTQAAIWDKQALIGLLRGGESAWQFERNASKRAAAEPGGYFASRRALLPYTGLFAHHVVEKGKWLPHERWIFSRKRVGCDFSKRAVLGWSPTLVCQAARLTHLTLSWFPYRRAEWLRRSVRRVVSWFVPSWLEQLGG